MDKDDALEALADFFDILEEHAEIFHSAIRHQRNNLNHLIFTRTSGVHHPKNPGVNFPNHRVQNAGRRED